MGATDQHEQKNLQLKEETFLMCAEEDMAKSVGSAQVKFDFDSQTLARVLVAFDHFAAADPVHEDQCVSIKMTKREYLDNAIRFSMGEWVTGNGDGAHLPRLQLVHGG